MAEKNNYVAHRVERSDLHDCVQQGEQVLVPGPTSIFMTGELAQSPEVFEWDQNLLPQQAWCSGMGSQCCLQAWAHHGELRDGGGHWLCHTHAESKSFHVQHGLLATCWSRLQPCIATQVTVGPDHTDQVTETQKSIAPYVLNQTVLNCRLPAVTHSGLIKYKANY